MTQQPAAQPQYKVTTPSGAEIRLLHRMEKDLYEEARDKYLNEYSFTAANDMRALDRLLLLEVQMYRAQWYTAAGMDYLGVSLDAKEEAEYTKRIKELGAQIADSQKDLGLTKAQRDKQDEDSVGSYIQLIKQAAKEHGVMREKQLGRAIELTKELFSLCGAYSRSNDEERRKLGFESSEDIVTWVLEYMKPEFDAVDKEFRANGMKFYRRKL